MHPHEERALEIARKLYGPGRYIPQWSPMRGWWVQCPACGTWINFSTEAQVKVHGNTKKGDSVEVTLVFCKDLDACRFRESTQ